jgi:hypothetical protein
MFPLESIHDGFMMRVSPARILSMPSPSSSPSTSTSDANQRSENQVDWASVTVTAATGTYGNAEAKLNTKKADGQDALVGVVGIRGSRQNGTIAVVEGFGKGTKELLDRNISATIKKVGGLNAQPPADAEDAAKKGEQPKKSWKSRIPEAKVEEVAEALNKGHGAKGQRIAEGLRAALKHHKEVLGGRLPPPPASAASAPTASAPTAPAPAGDDEPPF